MDFLIFNVNHGITTACVAFIFVCVIYPHLVKNRPQFYAGIGLILIMMFLSALVGMFGSIGFARFAGVISNLLQVIALLALLLSTGGFNIRQIGGEIKGAYEVIRRGETEKEVIIPRSAQQSAGPVEGGDVPAPPPPPGRGDSSLPIE